MPLLRRRRSSYHRTAMGPPAPIHVRASEAATPPRRATLDQAKSIADRLVPPQTVNREAKVMAYARGESSILDLEAENSPSMIALMLRKTLKELAYDDEMASNYRKFFIFLCYTALLLVVISMQRHVGVASMREQYHALQDRYFEFGANITRDDKVVGDFVQDFGAVETHLREVVLEAVFSSDDCGNDVCDSPDEYPKWSPGGREFAGCAADCGVVDTVDVTVVFYDAWKYFHAVDLIEGLAQESDVYGYSPAQWGVLDSSGNLSRVPAAGWNICHRTDREQGYLVPVCVFDANITVDTVPFRTDELNVSSSLFGNNMTVSLYAGEWDLRIGFQNFDWIHPETGASVPLAFPAIRGAVCVGGDKNCTYWDPCPEASSCQCEYIDNERVCFDDAYWSTFNVTTMLHEPAPSGATFVVDDPVLAAYPHEERVAAIGEWWRIPRRAADGTELPAYWTSRDPPLELTSASLDASLEVEASWSRSCRAYDLLLLSPDLESGWDSDIKLEIWTADRRLFPNSTQAERNAALQVRAYGLAFDEGEISCSKKTVMLCDDRQYVFGIAAEADGVYENTPGNMMGFSLLVADDDEVVFRGNMAWTYSPQNATADFECPTETFGKGFCFDRNRSFCVWHVDQEKAAYCDPTQEAYSDREKRFFEFAGYDLSASSFDLSGENCEPAASCSAHESSYRGSSEAYACEEATRDEWVSDAPTPLANLSSSSSSLIEEESDLSSLLTAETWPIVESARHVACAFTEDLCGWTSDGVWQHAEGTTPSDWTGPGVDGDPGFLESFAYSEATGAANASHFLWSPNMTLSGPAILTFDYHMYGNRMGSLKVDALEYVVVGSSNLTAWRTLWERVHNQLPLWHRDAFVVLEPETIMLRFATDTIHHTGDAAIDNVLIRQLDLPNATRAPTPFLDVTSSSDEVCAAFVMRNDAGEGWTESEYRIESAELEDFFRQGTFETGGSQIDTICFPARSGCYSLLVTEGSSTTGKHWELVVRDKSSSGEYSALAGRTPASTTFNVLDADIFESSCTLPPTYSPAPSLSKAPTCAVTLDLELYDSWGDGWAGAEYSIADGSEVVASGSLVSGSYREDLICLSVDDECFNATVSDDANPSEVEWTLRTGSSGLVVLNGSAPFEGFFWVSGDLGAGGATCAEAEAAYGILSAGLANATTDDDDNNQSSISSPPSSSSFSSSGGEATASPSLEGTVLAAPTEIVFEEEKLRCYANWRLFRTDVEQDLEDEALLSYYTVEPGDVVECDATDACVMVEYAWPPIEMRTYFSNAVEKGLYPSDDEDGPEFFQGLGGCKSDFTVMAATPWSQCVNQAFYGFAPPSACVECDDDDLCTATTSAAAPSWYSNLFSVPAVALYHSMDWALDAASEADISSSTEIEFKAPATISMFCDPTVRGDGTCDTEFNTLGCDYDGGDCCDDARTGCSAPWYAGVSAAASSWRYAVTTSTATYATVPYALRDAVADKLLLHLKGSPSDDDETTWNEPIPNFYETMMPSLACPECATVGSRGWRSINFTVEVPTTANTTNPLDNPMFPTTEEGEFRIRYFSSPNIVLYGPLLTQRRAKLRTCPTHRLDRNQFIEALRFNMDRLQLGCSTTASKLLAGDEGHVRAIQEDFGVDPTFLESSTLYRPGNIVSDYYDSEDVSETGTPYGFQYRMSDDKSTSHRTSFRPWKWQKGITKYPHSYPVFFSVNANSSRALEILDTVIEGGYFDDATDEIDVTLLLFNPQTETFAIVSSTYLAVKAGSVAASHEIDIVDVAYYSSRVDAARAVMEIVLVVVMFALVSIEFFEMYDNLVEYGSVLPYFLDFSNFIDFLGYAFQVALVPLWLRAVFRCNGFRPKATYDVHDDLQEGRILEAQEETHLAQSTIDDLLAVKGALDEYELFATLSIIALAMQCLKSLRFHPTFGLISTTIVNMSSKVLFWFMLLILVVGCYAVLGSLLFGHDNDDYATFASAAITLLAALSGMYDYTTLSLNEIADQIYFWTYMFIAFFVLLNVLLAIIVEGYDASVAETDKRDPLVFFARATISRTHAHDCLVPATTCIRIIRKCIKLLVSGDSFLSAADFDDDDDDGGGGVGDDADDEPAIGLTFLTAMRSRLVMDRRSSDKGLTYERLVRYMKRLPRLDRAVSALQNFTAENTDEIRRLALPWKPAVDEQMVALDVWLLRLALRVITPGAPDYVLDVWHVLALNLVARFGLNHDLHATEGLASESPSLRAFARLLEIHRLIDLDAIVNDNQADVPRVVAVVYNYQQGRRDSLIDFTRDNLAAAAAAAAEFQPAKPVNNDDEDEKDGDDATTNAFLNHIVQRLAKARARGGGGADAARSIRDRILAVLDNIDDDDEAPTEIRLVKLNEEEEEDPGFK
ncbi:hypothetical protein CTAYLR_004689 [Chrysophaeum taylorii]|uniref:MAM domain-containing protein n=1 Tax=Chrysophaeum taylorii TaxID=2483200 RepID=A0AAD7U7B3_9STRA|nr:hypothetical protein CTAYLR_004689 [Chrysophaeum taylorii]